MKKLFITGILFGFAVMSATAVPIIEFSPGNDKAGGWSYNGAGTIAFHQEITVDRGLGDSTDALVGALVYIPDLFVNGIPDGPYTITPTTNTIFIKSPDGAITYLSGTLGTTDIVPVGTTAIAYADYQIDITSVIINNTIGSDALTVIAAMVNPALDFQLSFQGAPSSGFKWMLDNYKPGNDGFSGAMDTIPEPATLLLFSFGALSLIRRKNTHNK